ncbi:MAG: type II toxin-antitoxin system VapC family toxin [Myxococcaceae bacterium]
MLAIVDTGPLYAVMDRDDADHSRCVEVLEGPELRLVVPILVVAEVAYLAGTRLGAKAEAAFVRGLERLEVEAPLPEDWERIAHLVHRYGNFPLGTVDASVVALAERLETELVVTLDERHFRSIRPKHCKAFKLLPTDA